MQRPPALPLSPVASGFGTPLRRFGIASRATQTLGIEYLDSVKKALDDLGATWGALATARSPTEILAVQAAYLQRAGERAAARSAAAGDALLGLTGAFVRPKAVAPAAARPGPAR
ncbi:hypothetical protein ASG32_03580 [Methylobacterium sp. Leaf361]|uniref:phasin family protein n=1 Tax=Methylobacterium sp. Leaf361 TaxID=1736352 RepID=UPI0006FCC190|nr:phasin family protein [Methylobacterium sp. Leaf361]KQS81838.1 hypothetical protein ASG32_03580 [Methylobacterium sp. Leaf361]